MNTQTIDILAIIGGSLGVVAMSIYYFRATGKIRRAKFESFKRGLSLKKPLTNQPSSSGFAKVS